MPHLNHDISGNSRRACLKGLFDWRVKENEDKIVAGKDPGMEMLEEKKRGDLHRIIPKLREPSHVQHVCFAATGYHGNSAVVCCSFKPNELERLFGCSKWNS